MNAEPIFLVKKALSPCFAVIRCLKKLVQSRLELAHRSRKISHKGKKLVAKTIITNPDATK